MESKRLEGAAGGILAAMAVICLGPASASAQMVPHHGFDVEADRPGLCLTCHDGSLALSVDVRNNGGCAPGVAESHPVGQTYPPPGREHQYHSVAEVTAAGIVLHEGKVTCIACHDITRDRPKHLVVVDTGSRLCLTCHRR